MDVTDDKWLEDLQNGDGHWKNMQQILRFSFQKCFSIITSQEKQIDYLNKSVSKVKMEILER